MPLVLPRRIGEIRKDSIITKAVKGFLSKFRV